MAKSSQSDDIHANVAEAVAQNPIDRRILAGIALIAIATIGVYLPAITGGFIWDDPAYVINNATLRDLPGLLKMWTQPESIPQWYPMVHTTFWIEYHLWELHPLGYHLVNVLLHIAAAGLLWQALRMLEVPGAWLAAAIFAFHPVHVESVAWITERKNVLSGVFVLLSLIRYLKFLNNSHDRRNPLEVDREYVWALVFFVAALLSKSVVATLPGVLAVIIWWKRGALRPRDLAPLIPFVLIGAASGLFTAYIEQHQVGALSERITELDLSILDRFVLAGRIIWFYTGKLVIPWPLVFIYPQWDKPDAGVWWQWAFPLGVLVGLVFLVRFAGKWGKGPAVGALIFCGALFPALGFMNVYPMRFSYVADHFQYHASMALIALAAAGLCRGIGKSAWVVLVPLLVLTAMRTPVYRSQLALWRDTLAKNPDSWMVNTNLAHVYRDAAVLTDDERLYDVADKLYLRALELRPDIHDTHTNVGMAYGRRREFEKALYHLNEAIKVNSHFAPAYYSIGQVYQLQGKIDLAVAYYRKALEISPDYPEANYKLGVVVEQQGNLMEAIDLYRLAVAGQPENADARYNLGGCLLRIKQFQEAAYNLLGAVRTRPDWAEAWSNLGSAQLGLGRTEDAIRSYEIALKLKPGLPPAQMGLQQAKSR